MAKPVHDHRHEKIGGFAGLILFGEVVLNTVLFHTPERRIGDNNIDTLFRAVVFERAAEGVDKGNVSNNQKPFAHLVLRFFLFPQFLPPHHTQSIPITFARDRTVVYELCRRFLAGRKIGVI